MAGGPLRPSKYRAEPQLVDGIRFASKKEARRYGQLKLLVRIGDISDLELQPRFPCVVLGHKVTTYVADFRYIEDGKTVVEDVKGVRTPIYRLKKKLVAALRGIEIRET